MEASENLPDNTVLFQETNSSARKQKTALPQHGLFDRLEREKTDFLDAVRKLVREELSTFAAEHILDRQILYSVKQAAVMLGVSPASIHILIRRGTLKVRRFGSRRLLLHEELVRIAKRDLVDIWPGKLAGVDGKRRTTRQAVAERGPKRKIPFGNWRDLGKKTPANAGAPSLQDPTSAERKDLP